MIALIHGGHRHGFNWKVVSVLKDKFMEKGETVEIIDLSELELEYSTGNQIPFEQESLEYKDQFADKAGKFLLEADIIYIVTPTYYNMPPAKLKNFIDRSDSLLSVFENRDNLPKFGAWATGEADLDSINCNLDLLKGYADVFGWEKVEASFKANLLEDSRDIDLSEIENVIGALLKISD